MSKIIGVNLLTNNLTFIISFIFGCGLFYGSIQSKMDRVDSLITTQENMQESISKLESNDLKLQDTLDNLNFECRSFRK